MARIKKVIQRSEIMSKNYKKELNKVFTNCRETSHPFTGCTPAELLFIDRQFLICLPQMSASGGFKIKLVQQKDDQMKTRVKTYYVVDNKT